MASRKRALKRVEILKSAAAAFRRRGYHGASMGEIAAALRMNKGNLYYYFRNKEEILFACHQYSLDRLLALLREIERATDPPDVKLRRLIEAFVTIIVDELHGTALFLDLEALSPAHLKAVIRRRDRFDRGVRRVLADGMRARVFAPGDPKLLTFAIFGALNWLPRWFSPRGRLDSAEVAHAFSRFFISGLRENALKSTIDKTKRGRGEQ